MSTNSRLIPVFFFLLLLSIGGQQGVADSKFYWPEPDAPYNETEPFIDPVEKESTINDDSADSLPLERDPSELESLQSVPLQDKPLPELPLEEDPLMRTPLEVRQIQEDPNRESPLHEAPLEESLQDVPLKENPLSGGNLEKKTLLVAIR